MNRHTAVFESSAQAEAAITELRRMGVADANLSIVGHPDGQSASVSESSLQSGTTGSDANGWHDGDTMNGGVTSGSPRLGGAAERGGVTVAVEDAPIADGTVIDVLQRHGGHIH